jgi:lactate dehydrogenase-like 2-hydroxyacid dehydrogenase
LGPILAWGRDTSAAKARAAGYDFAASKADQFERSRHRPERLGTPDDLARMKPTSLLVNTSRAGVIQAGALLSGLRNGRPGYAAVTGYEKEPVASGNRPLLSSGSVRRILAGPSGTISNYFRGRIELVAANAMGAAADQELELPAGR